MSNCGKCGSDDMVRIAMTLNGGPVTFCHCRRCEHRQWVAADGGGHLGLTDVLERAAS